MPLNFVAPEPEEEEEVEEEVKQTPLQNLRTNLDDLNKRYICIYDVFCSISFLRKSMKDIGGDTRSSRVIPSISVKCVFHIFFEFPYRCVKLLM